LPDTEEDVGTCEDESSAVDFGERREDQGTDHVSQDEDTHRQRTEND